MKINRWNSRLAASQAKLLPLITIGLLCVQILSSARNPIVMGESLPLWLLVSDVIFFVFTALLALWVRAGNIPEQLAHPLSAIAYLIAGLSALVSIAAQADPLPFYFAMVMLAGSFCFLSQRYLLICMGLLVLLWIPVASLYLTPAQAVSSFVVTAVGATLSHYILRRRILGMIAVYELEMRVVALESILPMCASCKKTRDQDGNWHSIEEYIEDNQLGTQISHGSCPSCTQELYGERLANRKPQDIAA